MNISGIPLSPRMIGKKVLVNYDGKQECGVLSAYQLEPNPIVEVSLNELGHGVGVHPDNVEIDAADFDLLDALHTAYPYEGCSDSSCYFRQRSPGGQHTNGGCRCVRRFGSSTQIIRTMTEDFRLVLNVVDHLYGSLMQEVGKEKAEEILGKYKARN